MLNSNGRLFAVFVLISILTGIVSAIGCIAPSMPSLSVVGNTLKDSSNKTIILHGVVRAGTEYMCVGTTGTNGTGIFDTTINVLNDDVEVPKMAAWTGMNSVTIGLNEDCWLGINGVLAAYSGTNYINAIKHEVATIESNGLYPVIVLFWEGAGTSPALSQLSMPDNDHAPAFWQSVANTFKTDQKVIFRLKEEPAPAGNTTGATAWQCWKNGDVQYSASGSLTPISSVSNCSEGFTTVGMQSLVNIIRGTGAQNVIAVPGVAFASVLNHFLDTAYQISDTLSPPQLMAAIDVYPVSSAYCNTTTCYNSQFAPVASVMPLWAGEIGQDCCAAFTVTTAVDTLITWLDGHQAGYSAWNWDTYANLNLITSYGSGTPSTLWGTDYKNHLATLH